MSRSTLTDKIVINLDEEFPHLSQAPVVEAVIDIRAQASGPFEEEPVRATLEPLLPGFSFLDSQREFHHEVKFAEGNPPEQCIRDLGWKGVRFQSEDRKKIVQFNRDGFVSSRLEPYADWTSFAAEALALWQVFLEIAKPVEINRVGLRYINRIELPLEELRLSDYIEPAPKPPRSLNLPYLGFMHHETFAVPEYPYAVNVIRTIQPPQGPSGKGAGLILDIDVFTTSGLDLTTEQLVHVLDEMRWLKNKVFFGTVTEKTLENLQ